MPDRALQQRYTVALPLRPTPYNHDMAPTPNTHTRRTVALATLSCAVLLAACGSSATNHSGSASHGVSQAVKYANCVRAHGVPNFPDLGTTASYHFLAQINPSALAFESAQKACAKYGNALAPPAPFSASTILALDKISHCIRAHGVPNFPDPASTGDATYQRFERSGIDPQSPAFKHAAAACGEPGLWGS
jgi:hypothetical protein